MLCDLRGNRLALNQTQRTWKSENEVVSPWLLYIFDVFLKQARAAPIILESDQFEYLLSQKQLDFWKWAQNLGRKEFNRGDTIKALGFPPRTIEGGFKSEVQPRYDASVASSRRLRGVF